MLRASISSRWLRSSSLVLLPATLLLVSACSDDGETADPTPTPSAGTGGASAGSGGASAGQGGTGGSAAGKAGAAQGGAGSAQGGAGAAQGGAGAAQGGAGAAQGGAGAAQGGAGAGGSGPGGAGGGTSNDIVVKQCGTTLPAAQGGVCDVQKGSGTKVIRGRVIGHDAIYEGGEVVISDAGLITCAGCDCSATAGYQGATTVTCADGVVAPAFINTHDHITYAQLSPYVYPNPNTRYDHRNEWRKGLNGKPKISSPTGNGVNTILTGELRFLLSGTTSTIGSIGNNNPKGLVRNLDSTANSEGLQQPAVDFDTFPLYAAGVNALPTSCSYGDVVPQATVDKLEAYLPHIAEGINDVAHTEFDCSDGVTPSQVDLLKPQVAMIHAIGLKAEEFSAMANDGTGLIWSPRSNISLYGFTANVTAAARMGVQIALGTDWTLSGSVNMQRELACADEYNKNHLGGFFSDYQLFKMVTSDAAALSASEGKIGSIKTGLLGDLTVWDGKGKETVSAVIRSDNKGVALVLRGGLVQHGESDLVDALSPDGGAGCEKLDICGSEKKVCAQRETGKTVAQITGGVNAAYPLFFCGVPDKEPTCVPFRLNEFTGVSSATDNDGDGIANDKDLCPDVFSAVRPMDKGAQQDADGDGQGDVCDVCPLKANSTECPLVQGDLDGDGKPDAMDNCPTKANADQADGDGDGKGDACDACPQDANPGATPCPAQTTTLGKINDGTIPEGSDVVVSEICVTGVHTTGTSGNFNSFFVQDPAATEFGGGYVFLGATAPTVAVWDKVTVSAKVKLFNGILELDTPTVTKTGTCAPIDPIVIADPASIATDGVNAKKYNDMLVTVKGVTVTVANPDAPKDFNEFAVTGNLRVDDLLYAYPSGSFPLGTTFSSLTGVLYFSFGNSKVEPRSAADLMK